MKPEEAPFLTVPRLEKIPFLIHGFGKGRWTEDDFLLRPEWKGFKLLLLNQIHSDIVHSLKTIPKGKLTGDAMITSLPCLFLIIKTADCLPVFIVDESKKVVAAVHCGWRGTQKRIVQKTAEEMERLFNCQPESLLVSLGPCIGTECYEVGKDVVKKFKQEEFLSEIFQPHSQKKNKYFLDLRKANLLQLLDSGIKRKNVFIVDDCSHCYPDLPSFRRDGEKAGRMLSFIGIKT